MRTAVAGKRTVVAAWAVALAASALAAVPAGAHARTAGGGYTDAGLRKDLAAVRAAGGGDVNVPPRPR
jgi:D-alanyl-D-alanine carboxypeptidase